MAFANSWAMMKASAGVLRSRSELALFPVLSGAASVVVAVSFFVPIALIGTETPTAVTYALLLAMYAVMAYVTVFCNAALISQADVALRGGDPSVAGGLRAAGSRWLRILPWALLSATVSWVLQALKERAGFVMQLVLGSASIAWQVVTFLVLPKIVLEDRGVVDAVKDSADAMRTTWGENVVGNAGLGLLGVLLALPGIALIWLAFQLSGAGLLILLAAAILWLLTAAVLTTALTGIYQTALYHFTRDGHVPAPFAAANLPAAFTAR